MAGTRSRKRKSSVVEHIPAKPTTTKLGSKGNTQVKNGASIQTLPLANLGILEPDTLQPGASSDIILTAHSERIPTGLAQSLPHRSRSTTRLGDNTQSDGDSSVDSEITGRETGNHDEEEQEGQTVTDSAVLPKDSLIATDIEGASIPGTSTLVDYHIVTKSPHKGTAKHNRVQKSALPVKDNQTVPMSSHKRFGSEDPPPQHKDLSLQAEEATSLIPPEVSDNQSEDDDDDDDDDAPEEIVANVAARKAKASVAKTAQSLKIQKDADRAKRRKRDLDLNTQAQISKKRKMDTDPQDLLHGIPFTQAHSTKISSTYMGDLPDELPAEILALESDSSAEISNARPAQIKRPNKRKRLDQDVKPANDILMGNTRVRILSTTKSTLPPPARHRASNAKETWLRDRINESKARMTAYKVNGAGARSFVRQATR